MSGSQLLLLGGAQVVSDPNFEYTTLLLPGNGTNGAQNNTFLDSSTNNFTITRNGNTTQGTFSPFSQTGWGNYFDGTGDWISAPSNAVFDFSGDFTIELWFYATTVGVTYQGFCGRRQTAANFGPFSMGLNNAAVLFSLSTSGSSWALNSTGGTVASNTWNHVAFVRSGTACTAYLNGTSIITGTVSGALASSSQNLAIGTFANDGTDAFNGYISNFRVVKGTAVYTANFTPSTTPLTAISGTSLLTCQSNRFVDNSSNAFAITRNGNTSVQAFSPFNPTAAWSAATNGGSGYFDGSGDYLSVADNAALDLVGNAFTIEAWIYPTTSGNYRDIITKRPSGTGPSYAILLNNTDNKLIFGNNGAGLTSTTQIQLNTWTHVAWTYDGSSTSKMWINGALELTSTFSPTADNNDAVQIGAWGTNNAEYFGGYITNVRIVKGTQVYTTAFTPPTAPLTAITNTSLLTNFTNAGIYDATSKNDLETVGNAQISTTQSKFGGSSMYFDGTGDYLTPPAGQNFVFGSGNFTIECWVYPTAFSPFRAIIDSRTATTNTTGFLLCLANASTGAWSFFKGSTQIVAASTNLTLNTWQHIAVVRSGTTITLYLNGTSVGSATDSQSFTDTTCRIGSTIDNIGWSGYINDLRVTKGVARYTANFTAPTAAFPLL